MYDHKYDCQLKKGVCEFSLVLYTDFNTTPLVYASLLVRGNLLTIHVAQLGCPIQKINNYLIIQSEDRTVVTNIRLCID